jgi:hypothetical protein
MRVITETMRDGHQPLTLILSPGAKGEAKRDCRANENSRIAHFARDDMLGKFAKDFFWRLY